MQAGALQAAGRPTVTRVHPVARLVGGQVNARGSFPSKDNNVTCMLDTYVPKRLTAKLALLVAAPVTWVGNRAGTTRHPLMRQAATWRCSSCGLAPHAARRLKQDFTHNSTPSLPFASAPSLLIVYCGSPPIVAPQAKAPRGTTHAATSTCCSHFQRSSSACRLRSCASGSTASAAWPHAHAHAHKHARVEAPHACPGEAVVALNGVGPQSRHGPRYPRAASHRDCHQLLLWLLHSF